MTSTSPMEYNIPTGSLPIILKDLNMEIKWGLWNAEFIWLRLSEKSVCVHELSHFSYVWLFVTLWTIAVQAPLSMEFSRQECWSGLSCPPLGYLPDAGIKPVSLTSLALAGRFFTTSDTLEACWSLRGYIKLNKTLIFAPETHKEHLRKSWNDS